MGLLNLLVLKKVNNDRQEQVKTKEQLLASPTIPSFIVPGVAAQSLLAALLVYNFNVPTRHLLFCTIYPAYLFFANRFRFGNNIVVRQRSIHHPSNLSVVMSKIFSESDTLWFKCYMMAATTTGILLPLLTVSAGPTEMADVVISPLFVLWTQIICETAVMLNPYVHRYIAFLIPLGFFVYRQSLLLDWFSDSLALYNSVPAGITSSQWYTFGLVLSSVNLFMGAVNLFVFTLMRWAPEFLNDDKCESPEIEWKMMMPFQMKTNGLKKKSRNARDEQDRKTALAKAA